MAVNPIIFDLKYTPYSLKRGASADEKRAHREERAFYDMTGGKNILGYMMTEDKQRGTFTNLEYLQKSMGVFNQNGMISPEELEQIKKRAAKNKGNIWHGFLSLCEEDSPKVDTPEKCIRLVKQTFSSFFKEGKFNEKNMAKFIAYSVIDEFEKCGETVYKPNIVFKVSAGVNRNEGERNFDLYKKSLLCTARKMIPTYLLCDCEEDNNTPAEKLSVMGCRTRAVDDIYGCTGAVGRGNIANISINLPRLALETDQTCGDQKMAEKVLRFKKKWLEIADATTEILLDRYRITAGLSSEDFPANLARQMWCVPFGTPNDVFKHGTLSIGFIGLFEAMEVLTGSGFYSSEEAYNIAVDFVNFMREICDRT